MLHFGTTTGAFKNLLRGDSRRQNTQKTRKVEGLGGGFFGTAKVAKAWVDNMECGRVVFACSDHTD